MIELVFKTHAFLHCQILTQRKMNELDCCSAPKKQSKSRSCYQMEMTILYHRPPDSSCDSCGPPPWGLSPETCTPGHSRKVKRTCTPHIYTCVQSYTACPAHQHVCTYTHTCACRLTGRPNDCVRSKEDTIKENFRWGLCVNRVTIWTQIKQKSSIHSD